MHVCVCVTGINSAMPYSALVGGINVLHFCFCTSYLQWSPEKDNHSEVRTLQHNDSNE